MLRLSVSPPSCLLGGVIVITLTCDSVISLTPVTWVYKPLCLGGIIVQFDSVAMSWLPATQWVFVIFFLHFVNELPTPVRSLTGPAHFLSCRYHRLIWSCWWSCWLILKKNVTEVYVSEGLQRSKWELTDRGNKLCGLFSIAGVFYGFWWSHSTFSFLLDPAVWKLDELLILTIGFWSLLVSTFSLAALKSVFCVSAGGHVVTDSQIAEIQANYVIMCQSLKQPPFKKKP